MRKQAKTLAKEELREIRKSWNMNQSEFGQAIGKSLRSVQCYEDGTTPVPKVVEKIIDYIAKEREAPTANAA
jgi:DNA-binding transcriptional regulator YiaG